MVEAKAKSFKARMTVSVYPFFTSHFHLYLNLCISCLTYITSLVTEFLHLAVDSSNG